MNTKGRVRIADYWFLPAVGEYNTTGVRALERASESLFAERSSVSGLPGVQNVRVEDLRWAMDSFAQGEGLRVMRDPSAETGYDRSSGIDLANTGQLQLAKSMSQQGSTGVAPTTVEGNAWSDDVGTSTVVSTTDRRLNNVGDRIKDVLGTLAAGTWQVDFYGYVEADPVILGSAFTKQKGSTQISGNTIQLVTEGTIVYHTPAGPTTGVKVTATAHFERIGKVVELRVVNTDTGHVVDSQRVNTSNFLHATITWTPQASTNYRYEVELIKDNATVSDGVTLDDVTWSEETDKVATFDVRTGSTTVVSGTKNLKDVTTSTLLGTLTFVATGAASYTIRSTRTSGNEVRQIIDRAVFQQIAMQDPRLIRLGMADKIFLVDKGSAAPGVFWWDRQNGKWTAVGTIGPAAATANAMASSDSYTFVGLDDKKVYRANDSTVHEQYVTATTDPIVGIAVGGGRLLILTEARATGTTLFSVQLENATVPVTLPAASYTPNNFGVNPDLEASQRIAGTVSGAVFFVNEGPVCWIYSWNGAAGVPLVDLSPGFRGRSIVHGSGLTYVGGDFPTVDSSGQSSRKPAVFVIDDSGTPILLPTKLYRDDDGSTHIVAMQLYGADLWVLTQQGTTAAPTGFRLWRVSLSNFAAFCNKEITIDPSQNTANARGLAITWAERFIAWGKGAPYRESSTYLTAGTWRSARYDLSLTEPKQLRFFDVIGTFPANTSLDVALYLDDAATPVQVGTFTASGRLPISSPGETVSARSVQVEVTLRTNDITATPIIPKMLLGARMRERKRSFSLLLDCRAQSAMRHVDGQALDGYVAAEAVFDYDETGTVVEFEDAASPDDERKSQVWSVTVENPRWQLVAPGEGLLRVELLVVD